MLARMKRIDRARAEESEAGKLFYERKMMSTKFCFECRRVEEYSARIQEKISSIHQAVENRGRAIHDLNEKVKMVQYVRKEIDRRFNQIREDDDDDAPFVIIESLMKVYRDTSLSEEVAKAEQADKLVTTEVEEAKSLLSEVEECNFGEKFENLHSLWNNLETKLLSVLRSAQPLQ
ncbi:hypothetical protein QAD02_023824 [Eretmocerus hayati]|nr:hypothetical protein QAD02_023824 [Eretmocerus hayati]